MNTDKFLKCFNYIVKELDIPEDRETYLCRDIFSYIGNMSKKDKNDLFIELLISNKIQYNIIFNGQTIDIEDDDKIIKFRDYFNSLKEYQKVCILTHYEFEENTFKKVFNLDKTFIFESMIYDSYSKNIEAFNYDEDALFNYLVDNFDYYVKSFQPRNLGFCIYNSTREEYECEEQRGNRRHFFEKIVKYRIMYDNTFTNSILALCDFYDFNYPSIREMEGMIKLYMKYSKDIESLKRIATIIYNGKYLKNCLAIFKNKYEDEYTKIVISNV